MTNTALLLQSLSLSTDLLSTSVRDADSGTEVSWTADTFTAATEDEDGNESRVSFPVTAADLGELHRMLTAHLGGVAYAGGVAGDAGYIECSDVREYGNGLHVEVGDHRSGSIDFDLCQLDVRSWHAQLTVTLLAMALAG